MSASAANLLLASRGRPKPPTRAAACTVRMHFQGAWVQSAKYSPLYQAQYGGPGQLPWFDAALGSYAAVGELDTIITQLLALGDTHISCFLDPGGAGYNSPGQPYGRDQIVPPVDLWQNGNPTAWLAMIDRVIQRGAIPMMSISGEGQDGWNWIQANLPTIVKALRTSYDRLAYGPLVVVYDGVWPPSWTVDQMTQFVPWFREIAGPTAMLGMMFAEEMPSTTPMMWIVGEGDWTQPQWDGLDLILGSMTGDKVQCPALPNWAQYVIAPPQRHWTTCNPEWDGPFILAPCSRGERFYIPLEWDEYDSDRDPTQTTKPLIDAVRANLKAIGFPGWG